MSLITFYHFNKYGKQVKLSTVHQRDFETMKILLLEDSQTLDIGDIYYLDEFGNEIQLDYYNS